MISSDLRDLPHAEDASANAHHLATNDHFETIDHNNDVQCLRRRSLVLSSEVPNPRAECRNATAPQPQRSAELKSAFYAL